METIFANATAPGKAGVSIVRISGEKAGEALTWLTKKPLPEPRKAEFTKIINPETGEIIDEIIAIYFPAPYSFTGEDIVELHLHGSAAIISEVLGYLAGLPSLRLAQPGEFSRRAFENGKMDLTQIEGLADLIDAETEIQKKQAMRQMQGELSEFYESWRKKLISIMANIEAYIDFPDEDIPESTDVKMQSEVSELVAKIKKHLSDRRGEIIREGINAVILGAPNVGKSSLMNHLSRRDVAIVSATAGTTRDVIEVHMNIGGMPVTLTDTAGIRESSDEIETEGIKRALSRAELADIKIGIFDANNYPEVDEKTAALLTKNDIAVINKIDETPLKGAEINGLEARCISITTGENTDKLIAELETKIANIASPSSDPLATRKRHRAELEKCVDALERFLEGRKNKIDIELCAEELRLAAKSLGRIIGNIDVEDILDEIFSSFCIGK